MGEQKINLLSSPEQKMSFSRHLLNDLESLDYMVRHNIIENDITRIGAEQEFCLVNEQWRPASNALDILKAIDDDHFTSELAKYNLEINLDPVKLEGGAFTQVENQLRALLKKATDKALDHQTRIVLAGIVPSISIHELDLEFMTPINRFIALNDLLKSTRGSDFQMNFSGVDELSISHNSVMFEACNTSFQLHLQIAPGDFTSSYNWAQAIAGPVLAVSANSPLLLNRELWKETRIALFQQSIDTREISSSLQNKQARVSFGENWASGGIQDYYKSELSKFRTLITKNIAKSSLEEIQKGNIPKLEALNLFNGTIYRWNRPCYGVGGGKPHIRIENRYIPSGPTVADEMANFAFWVGLMKGRPGELDHIMDKMDFEDAKSNFINAARNGSETIMSWMGEKIPLPELIRDILIPISENGLKKMNINPEDIDHYLGIILARLNTYTGAQWCINNYRKLKKSFKSDDASTALTQALFYNQQRFSSIDQWPASLDSDAFESTASKVGHIMSTSLVTADYQDSALLTVHLMKWNNIHHLPVVNHKEELLGLITWSHLDKHWDSVNDEKNSLNASDIMIKEVITVSTSTPIEEAIQLMQAKNIGCLPVLHGRLLLGIITLKDL